MPEFQLVSDFRPTGDQPQAIESLVSGLEQNFKHQTLLGATGTGKTFAIASVIEKVQRPTLVLAHNKTLAAQLFAEFKDFFPNNAVAYFVSYYDYYQPEAYVPRHDLYIEKDSSINEEINRLRLAATSRRSTASKRLAASSLHRRSPLMMRLWVGTWPVSPPIRKKGVPHVAWASITKFRIFSWSDPPV